MTRRLLFCVLLGFLLAACGRDSFAPPSGITGGHRQVIRLLPAEDVPPAAMQALRSAFAQSAARSGFAVATKQNPDKTLYLRGYFSAVADEEEKHNTLHYVFDILNRSGERLHRVRGFYPLGPDSTPRTFWSGMKPDGYKTIAGDVLKKISTWQKH